MKSKKKPSQSKRQSNRDSACMQWLETQVVEVRKPLRFGSRQRFIHNPPEEDETVADTTLRDKIDQEMKYGSV